MFYEQNYLRVSDPEILDNADQIGWENSEEQGQN